MGTSWSVSRTIRDWVVVRRRRRTQDHQRLQISTVAIHTNGHPAIPMFPHPSLLVGDFNCQYVNWDYSSTSPSGERLASWTAANNFELLHNSKRADSFSSHRWNVGDNPDLAFASVSQDTRLADRHVLGNFPRSRHRPSLIMLPRLKDLPTSIR